jgi:hypothetical protein
MYHKEAITKKKESEYAQWGLPEGQVIGGLKDMIQTVANRVLEDDANEGLPPTNEYGEEEYEMTNLGDQGLHEEVEPSLEQQAAALLATQYEKLELWLAGT